MKRACACAWICALATAAASCVDARAASTTVTLKPGTVYQTFAGWESVVLSTVLDYKNVLPAYDTLLDEAVNDLGITRIQIAVISGTEHPPGNGDRYINGTLSEHDYFAEAAYNIVNDNNDPNVANLNGFDFVLLDWEIEKIVLPFKKKVEARGLKFTSYVSYADKGNSGFKHYQNAPEYAEFMLVVFEHIKSKYGFVPDGINVVNEPDQVGWNGTIIGDLVARTGPRLAAAGFRPDFIVPSTANRGLAVQYFDAAAAVPGAKDFLKELSYHCYSDSGVDSLKRIADAGVRYGVRTSMNECWSTGNTAETLHQDLKVGRNSVWQQGPFNGPNAYYSIDGPSQKSTLNAKTRFMRQYYKFIRPGARRIEATSGDAVVDPLAFINSDGSYTVVIKASAAATVVVENLPAGLYGASYTTESQFDTQLIDTTISSGNTLTATIPRNGVMTIFGKSSSSSSSSSSPPKRRGHPPR